MSTTWSYKKLLRWKIFLIGSLFSSLLIYFLYFGFMSLFGPRVISFSHHLPRSAKEINEKTEYLQGGPDEEFRYYLKAKVTEGEFLEFTKELKLEWASPVRRSGIPSKVPGLTWWNPPGGNFLYAKGNNADYCVQADFSYLTGYLYLYVEQN